MKFIFFDLDNTLTDRKATIDAYAEYFLSEFRELLHDDISTDHLSSTFNELDKGGYETHDVRSAAIRDLNIWRNSKTSAELSEHWHNWVPKNSLPMRGIYECLNELLDMGFKLCLVTNGQSKSQRDKIKRLSLDRYFDKVIISEEVGLKKPNKGIFEYALNEMGCSAEGAFFIGDHPVNDILASTKIGFTAIWFEGAHPWPEDQEKPLRFRDLGELCTILRNLTN